MSFKKNGKKLGVLGGLGPAASAEFLRQLAMRCPANCDQEHPVVYMIADCDIPDRGTAIFGKGESPLSMLKQDIFKLAEWGADVIAVPCNTAHYFINEFVDEIPVEFCHIIEETVKAAMKRSPQGAWMLSTKGTRASGLYQKVADKYGYTLFIPNEEQSDAAQEVIVNVKANKMTEAGCIMKNLCEELWSERDLLVMTACTELPLGYDASGLPEAKSVSSISALVDAAVSKLYDEVEGE
ncbi:MAG: amino acid racemase [Phascolarctobacterium sp.]|nr:amino acid racemase [Phascolarctobacterium sp.]